MVQGRADSSFAIGDTDRAPIYDAVVVGAGFAGIYAMHRLRTEGFTAIGLEAASDVGGTWYWNRYPGARVDVESIDYSFSFSRELDAGWSWSERFAAQPEILAYLNYAADALGVRDGFVFDARVARMRFAEGTQLWTIESEDGRRWSARFVITAVGCLSAPLVPSVSGLESFEGEVIQTSDWPEEGAQLKGKRVAVIGTGSTGVQVIPAIAEEVGSLTVFQRSPNFSVRAGHRALSDEDRRAGWDRWAERRRATMTTRTGTFLEGSGRALLELSEEEQLLEMERAWEAGYGYAFLSYFTDTSQSLEANGRLADFVRDKIRQFVDDPETAEKLTPRDHPIGGKRICLDNGYYETYNLPNVHLVDLRAEPLQQVTASAIVTSAGEYEIDTLVLATGFDAITGTLSRIDIRAGEESIADHWREGASTYLGVAVAGFPNFFTVTGPGSPSVVVNVVTAIEQHVDWIMDHLAYLRDHGFTRTEPTSESEEWWNEQVAEAAAKTMHRHAASSWYLGTNVDGKKRQMLAYVGGLNTYRGVCDEIAAEGYRGFVMSGPERAREVKNAEVQEVDVVSG